jgi:acetoin utilization protein AcuC
MKTAFLYTDELAKFDYGETHPLKTVRLKLTYELSRACGLFSVPGSRLIEPHMAADEDLLKFHEKGYLEALKKANSGVTVFGAEQYSLGPGDNPVFRGLYDWSRLVTGATLDAASLVGSGEVDIAFSISGGLHHARSSSASGFCYVNDPVIAILSLLEKGKRVLYVDIDAHHGDGVQDAFYATDRVLTLSIHETGSQLFPGTGFEDETGEGPGKGYSVNIPMPPYSDDELFLYAFNELFPPLIELFRPDVVVSQLGVDSFQSDPLAHLNYTTNGFSEAVKRIRDLSPRWVALGGGGYDVANVARAWTLAWAIMNNVEIADEIPEPFLKKFGSRGFESGRLRDRAFLEKGAEKALMRGEVKRVVGVVKENVFPRLGG